MIVEIPFPRTPSKDVPQRAGIGRMLNVQLEQLGSGDVIYKRAPGLSQLTSSTSGSIHCRGFVRASSNTVLVAFDRFVEALTMSGNTFVLKSLGQLDGTKIVSLAVNNKTPAPDIIAVTEIGAFFLSASGAPVAYPDTDVGSPNSVTFGDGYFFFTYGSGACLASGINTTSINPLDTITVNSASDGLVRGIFFAQTLFLFTPSVCEAWTNTANPTGFPFSRSAVIPRGIINAQAVAGYESNFTSSLIWVGSDSIVYMMQGYAPYRISTNDMERRIQAVADKTTLRACVYMNDGHAFWQLSSQNFTFAYDLTNSVWCERQSYGQEFSRIEQSIYAFGKWIVGDFSTGIVGSIDGNTFTEYNAPLVWELTSLPAPSWPGQRNIARADFNFISGTGIAAGGATAVDPMVDISWSKDGGASFAMPVQRAIGKQGETNRFMTVLRLGQATKYGTAYRLRVSDPVFAGFFSGTMETA